MSKKVLGGIAAAAATAVIGMAAATPAHADSTDGTIAAINAAAQFTQDVTNAGFYNPGGAEPRLLLGITVCNNLDAGYTGMQEIDYVYRNSDPSMDRAASRQFVNFAVADLCPWHQGQSFYVSAQNGPGSSGGSSGTETVA